MSCYSTAWSPCISMTHLRVVYIQVDSRSVPGMRYCICPECGSHFNLDDTNTVYAHDCSWANQRVWIINGSMFYNVPEFLRHEEETKGGTNSL